MIYGKISNVVTENTQHKIRRSQLIDKALVERVIHFYHGYVLFNFQF